jgi:hypothetical protein
MAQRYVLRDGHANTRPSAGPRRDPLVADIVERSRAWEKAR